mmetsp:Transcript_35825/g.83486  ORF Transcript_35825/g.83486 Transcript_35825/m.83486 type:complete len:172 (+) Transcript_35825:130-645(+)
MPRASSRFTTNRKRNRLEPFCDEDANMFGSSGRSRRSRGRRSSSDDGAGMKPSVSERAITEMFKSYAEEDDPTIIGMDGIDKLCTDLEIDPAEDVRGLVLLWKIVGLSQSIPGQISSEEVSTYFFDTVIGFLNSRLQCLACIVPLSCTNVSRTYTRTSATKVGKGLHDPLP